MSFFSTDGSGSSFSISEEDLINFGFPPTNNDFDLDEINVSRLYDDGGLGQEGALTPFGDYVSPEQLFATTYESTEEENSAAENGVLDVSSIKVEAPDMTPEPDFSFGEEMGKLFGLNGIKDEPLIDVKIQFVDFTAQPPKRQKKPRKQTLPKTCYLPPAPPPPVILPQVHEVTTTSTINAPAPMLPRRQSVKKRGRTAKKLPLYAKTREQCANHREWMQVKRARNTKNFHEGKKRMLLQSSYLLQRVVANPDCYNALQEKDPQLLAELKLFLFAREEP